MKLNGDCEPQMAMSSHVVAHNVNNLTLAGWDPQNGEVPGIMLGCGSSEFCSQTGSHLQTLAQSTLWQSKIFSQKHRTAHNDRLRALFLELI